MHRVKFDNDRWEDAGKVFVVKSWSYSPDSTSVTLEVMDESTGHVSVRVLPREQVYVCS